MNEKIGRATIHNMDCMEFMKGCKDNQFDLAIVDPPYGIGESGDRNNSRGKLATAINYKAFHGDDLEPPDYKYFMELNRISKNIVIWGANHFIQNFPFAINSPCWIIWDKDNGKTDFADCEMAFTNFKTAVRKFKYKWQGMLQENMKNKEHRIHPTQKPVALYEWLLINYAKQGNTILDTHMGSGSIAIATNKLGFDLTAMELDKDYYQAACKRIKNESSQGDMFTPVETKQAEQVELSL
jgi:site-specific DNA-methyltransferase (adenine-specific)